MTLYTNVHDLPAPLVQAVINDPYTGGGDISATKLIDAPQIRFLSRKHHDAIVVDVSERIWSLLGQGVHTVLERAALRAEGMVAEQRLFADIAGWKVSGQFDTMALDKGILSDYKVTTVYKLSNPDAWIQQLNVLRWLAHKNGYDIKGLEIIAILRDWKKGESERRHDYPAVSIVKVPIPMWPLEEAEEFIEERVILHRAASAGSHIPCTDDERWYTGTSFALMKHGGKRALKVAHTREELGEPADEQFIQERPGEYRRCQSYCEVRQFCPQWNNGEEVTDE